MASGASVAEVLQLCSCIALESLPFLSASGDTRSLNVESVTHSIAALMKDVDTLVESVENSKLPDREPPAQVNHLAPWIARKCQVDPTVDMRWVTVACLRLLGRSSADTEKLRTQLAALLYIRTKIWLQVMDNVSWPPQSVRHLTTWQPAELLEVVDECFFSLDVEGKGLLGPGEMALLSVCLMRPLQETLRASTMSASDAQSSTVNLSTDGDFTVALLGHLASEICGGGPVAGGSLSSIEILRPGEAALLGANGFVTLTAWRAWIIRSFAMEICRPSTTASEQMSEEVRLLRHLTDSVRIHLADCLARSESTALHNTWRAACARGAEEAVRSHVQGLLAGGRTSSQFVGIDRGNLVSAACNVLTAALDAAGGPALLAVARTPVTVEVAISAVWSATKSALVPDLLTCYQATSARSVPTLTHSSAPSLALTVACMCARSGCQAAVVAFCNSVPLHRHWSNGLERSVLPAFMSEAAGNAVARASKTRACRDWVHSPDQLDDAGVDKSVSGHGQQTERHIAGPVANVISPSTMAKTAVRALESGWIILSDQTVADVNTNLAHAANANLPTLAVSLFDEDIPILSQLPSSTSASLPGNCSTANTLYASSGMGCSRLDTAVLHQAVSGRRCAPVRALCSPGSRVIMPLHHQHVTAHLEDKTDGLGHRHYNVSAMILPPESYGKMPMLPLRTVLAAYTVPTFSADLTAESPTDVNSDALSSADWATCSIVPEHASVIDDRAHIHGTDSINRSATEIEARSQVITISDNGCRTPDSGRSSDTSYHNFEESVEYKRLASKVGGVGVQLLEQSSTLEPPAGTLMPRRLVAERFHVKVKAERVAHPPVKTCAKRMSSASLSRLSQPRRRDADNVPTSIANIITSGHKVRSGVRIQRVEEVNSSAIVKQVDRYNLRLIAGARLK